MKKKVLFLITKANWGGAQRYVYDLATALDPTHYEPVVVVGSDGELTALLTSAGIRTICLPSLQRDIAITKEFQFARALWRTIRSERPDILHVNSSKAGGVGCFVGRVARVPSVIFTAHGWAFNEDRPRWQKLLIKTLHWLTVLLSHHTIAVSSAIKAQMQWPFAAQKMTIINPGRTISGFVSKLQARAAMVQITPELTPYQTDVWLLLIAELHPIKQHQLLIEAMQSIINTYPHVRLLCIGDGELRTSLANTIKTSQLTNHVFLLGAIPEAAQYLKAADLFVLPSKSESYGYVLHEAGLAKVPIVASHVGGITDIITDTSVGTLLNPVNSQTIAEAITTFLESPEPYHTKAQKLATHLQTRTVATMTKRTTALYDKVPRIVVSSN